MSSLKILSGAMSTPYRPFDGPNKLTLLDKVCKFRGEVEIKQPPTPFRSLTPICQSDIHLLSKPIV